jgi:hypothetical protein
MLKAYVYLKVGKDRVKRSGVTYINVFDTAVLYFRQENLD